MSISQLTLSGQQVAVQRKEPQDSQSPCPVQSVRIQALQQMTSDSDRDIPTNVSSSTSQYNPIIYTQKSVRVKSLKITFEDLLYHIENGPIFPAFKGEGAKPLKFIKKFHELLKDNSLKGWEIDLTKSSAISSDGEKQDLRDLMWTIVDFEDYLEFLSCTKWTICIDGEFAIHPNGNMKTFDQLRDQHEKELAEAKNTFHPLMEPKSAIELPPPDYLPSVLPTVDTVYPSFERLLKNLSVQNWEVWHDAKSALSPSLGELITFDQIQNALDIARIRGYKYNPETELFASEYNETSFEALVERFYNWDPTNPF